jgi:hypothetical protein
MAAPGTVARAGHSGLVLPRAPQNDEELWWLIKSMFGIELPRVSVCPNHISPFEAVAHAFFGREPNFAVWYASRGSGKSLALAVLGLVKAFVSDIDVTILGGSMTQSLNVREHMRKLMAHPNAPMFAVSKDQATLIQMNTGKNIRPLPASQTTVRGPHPPLQLLDEVDEMEWDIYNASLGQAMEQLNIHGQVIEEYIVASSTWQNPEGTFSKVIEDARERGLPIFTWCWRELLQPNGWMTQRFIDGKRKVISAQMWHTEYELNEPSAGSRAFDLDKVEKYTIEYPPTVNELHQGNGDHDVYVWEKPQPEGLYAVGADWAKEQDKTVIAVIRYDIEPRRLVKLTRVNRRPWDSMIDMFNQDTQNYHAVAEHDGTGIGNVVNDFVDYSDTTNKFVMIGRKRTEMLLDYITDFEHAHYRMPRIPASIDYPGVQAEPIYRAHRSVTVSDVYAPGKWNSHLPDDIAAIALAHRALKKLPAPPINSSAVPNDPRIREADKRFHVKPESNMSVNEGGVTIVDERDGFDADSWLVGGNGGGDEWSANI